MVSPPLIEQYSVQQTVGGALHPSSTVFQLAYRGVRINRSQTVLSSTVKLVYNILFITYNKIWNADCSVGELEHHQMIFSVIVNANSSGRRAGMHAERTAEGEENLHELDFAECFARLPEMLHLFLRWGKDRERDITAVVAEPARQGGPSCSRFNTMCPLLIFVKPYFVLIIKPKA